MRTIVVQLPPIENERAEPELENFTIEFLRRRENEFSSLHDFVNNEQLDKAQKMTHNWKSICQPYGLAGLGILAAHLEDRLKEKDLSICNMLLDQMKDYFSKKKAQLRP